MTDWFWVRHGPTHAKAFAGWRDIPADLSDLDHVERVKAALPEKAVCVSSDLIRATATADAVAPTQTRLPTQADLREFNFGEWDGMHWQDVAEKDPDLSRNYWENPGDIAPLGGESWNTAAARVNGVVNRLSNTHDTIIAVAHFGTILTQVQKALGCTPYEAMAHKIDNLSITHLQEDAGVWSVKTINQNF